MSNLRRPPGFGYRAVISARRFSAFDAGRIAAARKCAEAAHRGAHRKVSGLPYIVHPRGVASILAGAGYDADLVIAGLLHDTVEDGAVEPRDIERQFGAAVAELVASVTNHSGSGSWRERKRRVFAHLAGASPGSLALKCADALDNLRSIRLDLERHGDVVWRRLHPRPQLHWYFRTLSKLFDERLRENLGPRLAASFRDELRAVFP
jgi:(p)ppGpp synthase/HD superfamily hydrolase